MSTKKPAGSTSAANRRAQMRAEAEATAKRARQRKIIVTAVSVVVVAALVIAGLVWAQNRARPADSDAVPPNTTAAGDGIIVNPGVAEGQPVVELFFDYQCPGCGSLERSAGDVIVGAAQDGEYQLVYRAMTFLDTNLRNDSSVRAANAAACYAEVGDYAAYHALIFENQPAEEGTGYSDELLRDQLPAQLGTEGEALAQFQTCYDDGTYESFADRTNTAAARAGVTQTPTVRVDGEDLDLSALASPEDFPAAVAQAATD